MPRSWRELLKDERGEAVPAWKAIAWGIAVLVGLILCEWSRVQWYAWLGGK